MVTLAIGRFSCLSGDDQLEKLNHLVQLHQTLMPHQVAVATGCDLQEAMNLLMFLFSQSVAKPTLLVYHATDYDDPPTPIKAQGLLDGPPKPPLTCEECGAEITDTSELAYDFLFSLTAHVQFER